MMATDLQRSIDALWRIESPRVTAVLSRMLRDVGLAEDLAQDTLLTALERWPAEGMP
ncbi:MAG TPA: sigma factor, partial [Rhodanobacter sp.]|nr:sigma factor [Rhodanobacter sp.]